MEEGRAEGIPQGRIVEGSKVEIPGLAGEGNAKGGGSISTASFSEEETRPQELHGAKEYQSRTGEVPSLIRYTDLTQPKA